MISANLQVLLGGAALLLGPGCGGDKAKSLLMNEAPPTARLAAASSGESNASAGSEAARNVSSGSSFSSPVSGASGEATPGAVTGKEKPVGALGSSTAGSLAVNTAAGTAGLVPSDAGVGVTLVAPLGVPKEKRIAALPQARQEHGVVALKGKAYVLGGYAPNVTASVIAYNPAEDKWASVADFPSTFNHPNAVVVEEKLYVAGFYAGTSLTGPASGKNYVYDPDADKWSELKAMPAGTERAGSCVATLGSKIYVFGGGTDGEATTFASVYDVVQDSWAELPALIHSREHCSAFASNGKLYILGGRTHSIPEFRSPSLEFDPETKKYTDKTPIPTPRGGAASAVIDGRLFLFGGEGSAENGGVFDEVEAYDAQQDAWESFPSLLVPRHGYGAAYIDGRVYLSGGATKQGGAASDVNTVYYFE